MKTKDDPIAGPHHYWTHFCFGLVVGALIGLRLGFWFFSVDWKIETATAVGALVFGLAGGRWGDDVWYRVAEVVSLWWRRWW
jgi:hypothetical protein